MKKIIFVAPVIFLVPSFVFSHPILRDAGTLTRGKIPDARLNFGEKDNPVQNGVGVIKSTMIVDMASSTAFYSFTSTSDAQQTKFQNFRTTSDTTADNFKAFTSTSDAQQTKFQNFKTTGDTTADNFKAFTSTSDAQQTKFQNFRTTGDTTTDNFKTFTSTSDAQQTKFQNFRTTSDTTADNFKTFTSTSDAQQTKFQNFKSTGDVTLAAVSLATFSINTPFDFATPVNSTSTVLGSTNPYRTITIPAFSWIGLGVSSASWRNSGFAMSSGPVAGMPFNSMGRSFMEFRSPNVSTSIAYVEFRMPFEWDGSTISYQTSWFAASGTADTNVIWSVAAVAITSGTSAFPVFTSSTSVQSTYKAANQEALSPQSAGFSVGGSPVPGSKVGFWIIASGGGFDGLPHATELLISHRQAVWDGKSR